MKKIFSLILLCAFASSLLSGVDIASDPSQDFANADMVVAGRVVGIDCILEADDAAKKRNEAYFGYYARVRICRIYKGNYGIAQDALIPIGGYWARIDSGGVNLDPLLRNGGSHRLELEAGGVYVLFLKKGPAAPGIDETWEPRSRQQSIIPILQDQSGLVVSSSGDSTIPLETYIARMKKSP